MKTIFKIKLLLIALSIATVGFGQCGAVIVSSDDTIICAPQVVKFKASNFPAGTTFEWNVGGGYVSSDSTYINLFSFSGKYNVSLRLTYTDGSKCTISKNNFIDAKPKPVIKVTPSLLVICNFNDSVTLVDNTLKSVSRDWLLNNTLYKNGPKSLKVLYTYPSGYKNVTVFLRDSFGCTEKKTIDSIVYVSDSVKLDFLADKLNGCIPKLINFTNLSDTVKNKISVWNWSFPKAVPNSSFAYQPKNIRYNTTDTFDVILKVTTKKGCTYTHKKSSYLQFADSLTLAVAFSRINLCGGQQLTVSYLNSRSPYPGYTITPGSYSVINSTPTIKTFKFTDIGQYSFVFTDEKYGCKSERTYNKQVTVNGPLAFFKVNDPISCLKPDTFIANDFSVINNGVGLNLKWNLFFDSLPNSSLQAGTGSQFKAIAKYFAKYTIRMIATGTNGCIDTVTQKSAIVLDSIKPKFTWIPIPACPGEFVNFNNATVAGSSKARNFYKWTFYGLNNSILGTDTNVNPKFSYPDTGRYTIKLLAYNKLGCKDSAIFKKKVLIQKPRPTFEVKDSNICGSMNVKLKVIYEDTSYYRNNRHIWILQHKDSLKYYRSDIGDSVYLATFWPGIYNIMCVVVSKTGKCVDTFRLKTRLSVSGVRYKTQISDVKGCNPFTLTLKATKLMEYNFKNNTPSKITNYWSTNWDTTYLKIQNPGNLITPVKVKKAGTFYFGFSYYHSSGCSDSSSLFSVISGVQASFNAPFYGCVGRKVALVNISDPDAVKFKWFIKDSTSAGQFGPNDTGRNPNITFNREGVYSIGLITYGNGLCTDTGYRTMVVNNIKAQFTSNDTLNYCAPIITTVSAKTHPYIYKYSWKFSQGDTITENLSTISTLFLENTGPAGSDVRLIVDAYGCSDTLEKKGFITVIGPIPRFTITNIVGCEKLNVKFANQSKYFNRFYLEYGDGTYLDSINFNKHTYQIFDRSLSQQVFKPKLYVIDSLGCLAVFKPKDSIIVKRSPNANYTIDKDTGCSALKVVFKNISLGSQTVKWDFDGDGKIDNNSDAPQYYYPTGDFKPVLIARSANGCEDTLKNKFFIKAYAPPVASFVADKDTICYNGSINFTANSLPSNAQIKQWLWDFGNPNTYKDSSTKQNPTFTFNNIKLNQVVLFVRDINNCIDTFTKYVFVNDTIGLPSPPINFVTIQNNNDIFINWTRSTHKRFIGYNLYKDFSGLTNIFTTANRLDTSFKVLTGIDVSKLRYCYTINTIDNCNVKGKVAKSHCTILLNVTDSINELRLNWLAYSGWDNGSNIGVGEYYIYRNENGGAFKLYDSVEGKFTRFIDKQLCNKNYCYYIIAVEKNKRWKSQSNTACGTPKYVFPSQPVIPIAATVLSGTSTYTRWLPYKFVKNVKTYHISRSFVGSSPDNFYATSDSAGFIDKGINVNTNEFSYNYAIRAEDHCGNFSPKSSNSKTILLKGSAANYINQLNWNAYEYWFSGIKQYEVFLRDKNTFNFLSKVDNITNIFEYKDDKLDDSICFYVEAVKDSLGGVISRSNVACLIAESQVWVPNVFTPNKDGNNEVFIPSAILVYNKTGNPILDYHMEIYNRWGEKVFESFDVQSGWDGSFSGKPCQEGHYLYKIKALSLDGAKNFNLEGVITLLR
ncbi:MAG: gliding motility-associated C-terminal domain-containing protein [bacterium]|nr:gliding motility-associated C-terminal domain-containing protein [bacterium]